MCLRRKDLAVKPVVTVAQSWEGRVRVEASELSCLMVVALNMRTLI